MKRTIYIVIYWMAAIFLTSILLTSLDYDLGKAVLMSLSFLPASLALCFFLPNVERNHDGKKRILNTIYVILGVMVTCHCHLVGSLRCRWRSAGEAP